MRKSLKKFGIGALVAPLLALTIPATPAFAIDSVACGQRTDFLKLEIARDMSGSLHTNRCFANAGVTAVNLAGVDEAHSGNNKVTINWEDGGRYYTHTMDRYHSYYFLGGVRVYEVRIW